MAISCDLRQRILNEGADALSSTELVALVADVPMRAAEGILESVKSVHGLNGRRPRELMALPLVTERSALKLLAAVELGRRSLVAPIDVTQVVGGKEVAAACSDLAVRADEVIAVLSLNRSNQLLHRWIATRGCESGASITPRDLFSQVLKEGATTIVLVHNHPGSSLTPSASDNAFTRRVSKAARVLGVRLLDHVIVTRNGFISLRDHGKLEGVFDD